MSEPQVLFVGCDKGSWQMRGRQIGRALGARCTSKPVGADWQSADVIVLVKRAAETWFREARASTAILIWDVLDVWHQPIANQRAAEEHIRDIVQLARALNVRTLVGATEAMATQIGGVYLPHHCRLGLSTGLVRSQARRVGYDGSPRYLGSWKPAIERACERLGLQFVVNPRELTDVDALVAFRGDEWDGWACRQWKSGVKYVNAIVSGRPILTQACAGFSEIAPTGLAIERPEELSDALAALCARDLRWRAYDQGLARAHDFTLEAIASRYRRILRSAVRAAA